MPALHRSIELEKYELLEEIGHGGMATVYRARDRRLQREVAVKLIHPHLRHSVEISQRFITEATTVARLKHDNIVEVYDVSDADEDERYLVVELVRGRTLRQLLDERGALPPEVAVALLLEVADGLCHAHQAGVVHRDVKPENVLLEWPAADSGEPLRVKLTDFGIAKLLDAQGVTSTGQVLGSPAHMAPEQIEGGEVDARTDVFGLAVMSYECLTGRLPFSGEHPAQVLRRVLDGEFLPLDSLDPRIGSDYARIVAAGLERNAATRTSSIEEYARQLREVLRRLGFDSTAPLLQQLREPRSDFESDIVERLIVAAEHAREEGRVGDAARSLGRALCYQPGNRRLLALISGLRRSRRWRFLVRWSIPVAAVVSLSTVGLFWLTQDPPATPIARAHPSLPPPPSTSRTVTPAVDVRSASGGGELAGVDAAASSSVAKSEPGDGSSSPRSVEKERAEPAPRVSEPEARAQVARRARPKLTVRTERRPGENPKRASASKDPSRGGEASVESDEQEIQREVRVRITGAMGGSLRIDGQDKEWFGGVRHPLPVGPHRFEFVAPDSTCCVTSTRLVEVVEGEGPQQVVGHIGFRDATLRVAADVGQLGQVSCPTLFAGEHAFPGELPVAMSTAQVTGTCTLRSREPDALPQSRTVTLRAGRTTVISWR